MNKKLKSIISQIYKNTRNTIGTIVPTRCIDYLTYYRICSILGIANPKGSNERYSRLSFAVDAQKDSVAVILGSTSDPMYNTPESRCAELADIAISKGSKLLIAKKQYRDYPTLIVDDPFEAYCSIISILRRKFSPKTVSITGSIGKTSVTEMVYAMMNSKFNTLKNPGSSNAVRSSGTVVQGLKKSHEVYIQEVMEGPPYGAASTISKLVQPQCAVVTRIGTSHMEAFGSQERILESCLGIQDGMPEDGLLVLNADDPFQWQGRALCTRRVMYYGIDNEEADYRAVNIHSENDWRCFDVQYDTVLAPVRIHCFGKHNILNAVAAFAVGKWVGMSDQEIADGLTKYKPDGIRQNLIRYGGYQLYLDCFNASPESVEAALNTFAEIPVAEGGRHIAVLADVAEVGSKAEEYHRKIGRLVSDSCVDLLICYGSNSRFIAEEASTCGRFPVYYSSDRDSLLQLIKEHITPADITLFKGSHSMELEHVVDLIWGTWYHEKYERYDFKTHTVSDENFSYCVYTDHVTVTKQISNTVNLILPDEIEGFPVTGIESNTFNGNKSICSVKMPSGLVNIRNCSFTKADKLTELSIPSSVRIIDDCAFSNCNSLCRVNIADGCTHIGHRAFSNCKKLEAVILPDSIQQIDNDAFINCDRLTIYTPSGSYAANYAISHGLRMAEK